MSLFDLVRRSTTRPRIDHQEGLLSRYKHMRHTGQKLNNKLVERLPKDVLDEGAMKLGILKKGIMVFDSMDESSVLMDYCIYDVRRNGCNAVEQYLKSISPDSESDEANCLRAMQRAIYSLFVVESVERGLGITVRDVRTNEVCQIVDVGLGGSANLDLILASRLIPHDGFWMTGGAALPVGKLPGDQRDLVISKFSAVMNGDREGYYDPAPMIKECLAKGSSSHVRYHDATENAGGQVSSPPRRRPVKIGRNESCPCGSGRKYKFCCLNRDARKKV